MTENIAACDHRVVNEGDKRRMIIDCKGCNESYDPEGCLPGIILAMEDEFNVDELILSGHIEEKYTEEGIKMLKSLRDLSKKLDRFSTRDPDVEGCDGCGLDPATLYPDIKEALIKGEKEVFQIYLNGAKTLMQKKGCSNCRKAAKEELGIIGEDLIALRDKVLLEAYGILGR